MPSLNVPHFLQWLHCGDIQEARIASEETSDSHALRCVLPGATLIAQLVQMCALTESAIGPGSTGKVFTAPQTPDRQP